MCHFISLILKGSNKKDIYASVLSTRNKNLHQYQNSSLSEQLKSGEFLALPEGKFCDCGTALGSFHEYKAVRVSRKEIEKLRRSGWTETKIKHWLEEKKKYNEREKRI